MEENLLLRACSQIISEIWSEYQEGKTPKVTTIKNRVCKRLGLKTQPKLTDLIAAVPEEQRSTLLPLIKAKPVRTASGVAVVAVMCKPHRCPHIAVTGNICVYCPGGPDSDFEYSTQSYTGYEPTSMRAIRARYDPWEQAKGRIEQLRSLGHAVDKVEYIVMGGTFMSLSTEYKDFFIRRLYDALSNFSGSSVADSIQAAQHSPIKCVAITIETRPDFCTPKHLDELLLFGCTRLEIGVQSVFEDVARDTNRGHTVRAVSDTFEEARNVGFKIVSHMMPNLPNVPLQRDLAQFREYFENPAFRSDGLKIYPTLVIRGTGLYELWKTGRYESYPPDSLIDLLAKIMSLIPPWTRVYRVQRDIPMPLVSSGVEHGNLRELVMARMKDYGLRCRDVRTREAGIQVIHGTQTRPDHLELCRRDYVANAGWETFLSYEDPLLDTLIALLRLRKITDSHRKELMETKNSSNEDDNDNNDNGCCSSGVSIVRELHVYGTAVPVHSRDPTKFQHQGYGTLLMEEAERIAKEEHGSWKLAVISGIGTRNYYEKLGYHLDGPYMSKVL